MDKLKEELLADLPADIQNYMRKLAEMDLFMTEDEIENYKEAFLEYDKDGSGNISIAELGTVMRTLGENPTEDELQDLINKFDEDGNNCIEFTEFLCMMAAKRKEDEENEFNSFIPTCFRVFRDGDETNIDESKISIEHFRYIMQSLPRGDMTKQEMSDMVRDMVDAVDDGDGFIDYEEFKKMIMKY